MTILTQQPLRFFLVLKSVDCNRKNGIISWVFEIVKENVDMKKFVLALMGIGIIIIIGCSPASNSEAEKAALKSAKAWLTLVDSEEYEESWDEAAGFFKGAVPQEQWQQSMQSIRKPFGKNISRKLQLKLYLTSLPGAPDGEYVVIKFDSSFENKKYTLETVTPMLDKDGKWRISGYFMK